MKLSSISSVRDKSIALRQCFNLSLSLGNSCYVSRVVEWKGHPNVKHIKRTSSTVIDFKVNYYTYC